MFKNTLVRFAARNLEIDIDELLTGPTALAFVSTKPDGSEGDIAGVAKIIRAYSREVPALVVKGGVLGTSVIDAEGARLLADMPSRREVLAQIAGLLEAPLSQMAGLLAAAPRDIAYAIQALVDKQGGAPADEAKAPAADAEAPASRGSQPPAKLRLRLTPRSKPQLRLTPTPKPRLMSRPTPKATSHSGTT